MENRTMPGSRGARIFGVAARMSPIPGFLFRPFLKPLLVLLALLVSGVSAQTPRIITVGGPGSDYATLGQAIAVMSSPMTENVEIRVEVPPDGFTENPLDVEAAALGTGIYTLEIVGVPGFFDPEDASITYYVGGHAEYRVSEDKQVEVIHKYGVPVRQVQSDNGAVSVKQFYLTDHLGSTVTMTNPSGTASGPILEYFPFGKQQVVSAGSFAPVTETFTGKELDVYDETADPVDGAGLYYFGGRYFDADLGMWISPDPAGQFNSAYAYSTNPVSGTDGDGEFWNVLGQVVLGGASEIAYQWAEAKYTKQEFKIDWKSVGMEAAQSGNPVSGALKIARKAGKIAKIMKQAEKVADGGKAVKASGVGADATKVSLPKIGSKGGPGSGKPFSESVKDAAEQEADGKCVFCGVKTTRSKSPSPTRRNTDHATSKKEGGNNTLENAQNTCQTCNLDKGAQSTDAYLKRLDLGQDEQ